MIRIRLILLCVVFLLACVAIGTGFLIRKQGPQITAEQCERLQPGMTEDEVAAILGGPAGDYTNGQGNYAWIGNTKSIAWIGNTKDIADRRSCATWCGHQGAIEARFDAGGKLTCVGFFEAEVPANILHRTINYFGWPKGKVVFETDGASSIRPVNDPKRDRWQHPEEIVAALALKPGATVADFGETTFYMVTHLSKAVGKGGTVIEIDTSSSMADFLANYAGELGPANIVLRKAGPDAPELPTASVDGVLMLDAWLYVNDKEACAKNVYEGLKRGGRFVVVEYKVDAGSFFEELKEKRLEPGQVTRQLEAAGFRVEVVRSSMPRQYMVVGHKD